MGGTVLKLRPSLKTLELAILDIFNREMIPVGGLLDLNTLEEDWQATGLRLDDLERGTRALIDEGALEYVAEPTPALRFVSWKKAGVGGVFNRVETAHTLAVSRKRREKSASAETGKPEPGRRAEDGT